MSIRLLHTSDWHLGKKLFKKSRLPEQEKFLDWLARCIIDQKIDILLIAGDIFDVPTPPNEASRLYYNFLNTITKKSNTHVVIIPGNHDSADYLSAPIQLLKKHRIHIVCGLKDYKTNNHIILDINDEKVCIKALPYFRTYELYNEIEAIKDGEIEKEDIENYIREFFSYWPELDGKTSKIVMAHHAFGSPMASGSEQVLMLSGLESIPLTWLGEDFDYIALGHIHKPQVISNEKQIHYCGSPIPLRFSEKHNKHVNKLISKSGKINLEKIPIPIFKKIVQIKTSKEKVYQDIDSALSEDFENSPFVELILKLETPDNLFNDEVFNYVTKKGAVLLSFIPEYTSHDKEDETINVIHKHDIKDLFKYYYKQKYPLSEEVPEKLMSNFIQSIEELNDEDRLSQS